MEAQFSDAEFSDILGAFAEVDDMLIGWDALMNPPQDANGFTLPVDQSNDLQPSEPNSIGSFPFAFDQVADKIISAAGSTLLGPPPQNPLQPGPPLPLSPTKSVPGALQNDGGGHAFHPFLGAPQQGPLPLFPDAPLTASQALQAQGQQPLTALTEQQVSGGQAPFVSPHDRGDQYLQNQLRQYPQAQQTEQLTQQLQQQQQQPSPRSQQSPQHLPQASQAPLPYLVQTPSSSFAPEPYSGPSASGSDTRRPMDVSTAGDGGGCSGLMAAGSGAADTANFSRCSGAASEYDGDGGGGSSAVSATGATALSQQQQQQLQGQALTAAAAVGGGTVGGPSASGLPWPPGAVVTSDAYGTVVWAPVAHLPPTNPSGLVQAAPAAHTAAPVFTMPPQTGLSPGASTSTYQTASAGLLQGLGGLGPDPGLGPGPGIGPRGEPVPAGAGPAVALTRGSAPATAATWPSAAQPAGSAAAATGGWSGFPVPSAAVAGAPGPHVFRGSAAAEAVPGLLHAHPLTHVGGRTTSGGAAAVTGAGFAYSMPSAAVSLGAEAAAAVSPDLAGASSAAALPAASGPLVAAMAAANKSAAAGAALALGAPAAAPPRTVWTTTGGGGGSHSGASLLAELVAEAAAGGWAAVATGLAPLPAGTGRTAEELLEGLDLQEVFAPPKPSHAKRIRGHVRRAAELKAQLAERVRAIQRLAAENADLRGRSRVLELVVRCRDEQLRLLRNYRTSPDGKVYYVDQPEWLGPAAGALEGAEAQGAAAGAPDAEQGPGAAVAYIGANPAALATMPAAGLLEMFRKLVADVSASLAAVERENPGAPGSRNAAEGAAVAQPAAGPARTGKSTRGSRKSQEPAAAPPPPAGGPGPAAGEGAALPLAVMQGGGGDAGSPYSAALAQLRRQMGLFRNVLRYLGLVNEEACKFADTMLTGETAAPEPGHWLRVVQALGLSQQQMADAAALHSCWQDWLTRIHTERRSIAAALDQLLSVNRYGATYFESVGQYGTDRDVIHKMHANVMRERILVVLTGEVFCCHILTDLQWARAIVHSYPYILDVREIVRAVSQLYYAAARGLMSPGSLTG